MNTFDFVYYLEVFSYDDEDNSFEVPVTVTVLVEPAEPEVGIPYRSISAESIQIPGLTEDESATFFDQMNSKLQNAIDFAAEAALTNLEEDWEPDIDEDRPRWYSTRL